MGALRVGLLAQAQSPSRIAFAGQQSIGKTLWLAKRIRPLQQTQCGSGADVQPPVDIAVLAGHHVGQVAAIGGHPQALAKAFQ